MRRDAEEEEYDPLNPGVGSLASVICVKPRPKVPAALQANKNLILKAMAEAQKSVASAPKRVEPPEVSYIVMVYGLLLAGESSDNIGHNLLV